jgi:hypothetical protein
LYERRIFETRERTVISFGVFDVDASGILSTNICGQKLVEVCSAAEYFLPTQRRRIKNCKEAVRTQVATYRLPISKTRVQSLRRPFGTVVDKDALRQVTLTSV